MSPASLSLHGGSGYGRYSPKLSGRCFWGNMTNLNDFLNEKIKDPSHGKVRYNKNGVEIKKEKGDK